jgi:hypothetical protein
MGALGTNKIVAGRADLTTHETGEAFPGQRGGCARDCHGEAGPTRRRYGRARTDKMRPQTAQWLLQ